MCFYSNRLSWGINHSFISLYFKYQSPRFISLPTILAPVISSLDEIYRIYWRADKVNLGPHKTVHICNSSRFLPSCRIHSQKESSLLKTKYFFFYQISWSIKRRFRQILSRIGFWFLTHRIWMNLDIFDTHLFSLFFRFWSGRELR